ncbi:MAG: cytochrome c [Planctomycetota bacterium]
MASLTPWEVTLGLLLGGALVLHVVIDPDLSRRNVEVLPDMARSPAFHAQEPNPWFPDGKTLRTPVTGTVARGRLPLMADGVLLDVETPEWAKLSPEQQAAWDGLASPADPGAGPPERGRNIFNRICATCHGLDGQGRTPSTQRGVPPPPPLTTPTVQGMSDGRLFRVITAGQGNMASHANHVTREERWQVIRYLRTLRLSGE